MENANARHKAEDAFADSLIALGKTITSLFGGDRVDLGVNPPMEDDTTNAINISAPHIEHDTMDDQSRFTFTHINPHLTQDSPPIANDQQLTEVVNANDQGKDRFPIPAKKKLGRPPKPRPVIPSFGSEGGLAGFLSECFVNDEDAVTLVAFVRARYRLWNLSASKSKKKGVREETAELVSFFEERFHKVNIDDKERMMTSSYYKGIAMKPWVPPVPGLKLNQEDVDTFVREKCEVHVMGRATTADLLSAFAEWKGTSPSSMTYKERQRFLGHMESAFVRSMVPTTMAGTCSPGFFGLYLNDATAECREVGYNRSPNTRATIVKLDRHGNVVQVMDSLHDFALGVLGKSDQYVCKLMSTCFADGMKGLVHSDGYEYMRTKDHDARCLHRLNIKA